MPQPVTISRNSYRAARGYWPLCTFSTPAAPGAHCHERATSVVYHRLRGRADKSLMCGEHGRIIADAIADACAAGIDCR